MADIRKEHAQGFLAALLVVLLGPVTVWSAAGPDYTPPPGAVNPQVTQANINQTICVRGWTRTVRPPVQYTDALKRQQMAARHYTDTNPADYEEDHDIPLEVGGNPTNLLNLWPQPIREARMKDKLENALNKAVCGGKMTLHDAQECIRGTNWTACARRMGTPIP